MCGVNGIIDFNKKLDFADKNNKINAMNNKIIHRGPDSDGIFVNDDVALGMRRLSIQDVSNGNQPIFNEDSTLLIFFNGEIYNFKNLRETLLAKGYCFRTQTDTEVVLHAYQEYGIECLKKFDGMFAFVIYNIETKETFIARDRSGEKPLYYSRINEKFIFASELKSILVLDEIKREIDKDALRAYFQLTYIPAPLSIFKDVYKLEAGSYIIIKNGEIQVDHYWDMQYSNNKLIENYEECKGELRKALFESVSDRMIADVPIGAFLSGGIDSNVIVGIMSKLSDRKIDTFTIGFQEKQYDESNRSIIASKFHDTNHHLFCLNYDEALCELDNIISNIDEPFADSSLIPTYFVSREARKTVKVVLTGDAGDELFAGYSKYLIDYYENIYKKVPKFLRKGIFEKILKHVPDNSSIIRKVKKVVKNSNNDLMSSRKSLICLGLSDLEIEDLFVDKYENNYLDRKFKDSYTKYAGDADELSQTLYADYKIVLEGDMLTKVDRASMLASIETRVPMLSHNVIEVASRIPSHYKINAKKQKIILKDAFSDLIPTQLLAASKSGFSVPVDNWLRDELKEDLERLLDDNLILDQGLFYVNTIKKLKEEHYSYKENRKSELWALYIFQKWFFNYCA